MKTFYAFYKCINTFESAGIQSHTQTLGCESSVFSTKPQTACLNSTRKRLNTFLFNYFQLSWHFSRVFESPANWNCVIKEGETNGPARSFEQISEDGRRQRREARFAETDHRPEDQERPVVLKNDIFCKTDEVCSSLWQSQGQVRIDTIKLG